MAGENEFLLHSLLMGVFIPFVYDLLRIFRRVIPHRPFLVSLEDLVFWIYCGSEVFLLMYHESNGTLRWFAVIGALAGMGLYGKLCSGFFVKYASWLLGRLLDLLLGPFRFLLKKLAGIVGKMETKARRRAGRWKRSIKMQLTYFLKKLKINFKT